MPVLDLNTRCSVSLLGARSHVKRHFLQYRGVPSALRDLRKPAYSVSERPCPRPGGFKSESVWQTDSTSTYKHILAAPRNCLDASFCAPSDSADATTIYPGILYVPVDRYLQCSTYETQQPCGRI
ncbi:unnamed protein product [Peniophora sp. CBMAI 1063]|nr:unnamed protein product [Peniophora sp. CBMAI 1063]